MPIVDDLAAARTSLLDSTTKMDAVVNGPSSGATSLVTTGGGSIKTLARLQAEYGVGERPGYATATTFDGEVLVSSGPMVSPIGRLKKAADDGTGRIKLQSQKKHGLADGDEVVVSADGWHGVTHREHPANGTWEIVVVDPYWFVLVDSTWVADSVFGQGQFWRSDAVLIDARPIYVDLKDRVKDAGGGTIRFPGGHIWCDGKMLIEEDVNLEGVDDNVTFFVQADGQDDHFFQHAAEGNFKFTRATLCCRRHRQDLTKGLSGLRLGADGVIQRNITVDITIEAPAGYAVGAQSSGAFQNCKFNIRGKFGDSDIFDPKNRMDANTANEISGEAEHYGLYRIGTNFASETLPTNPFTTVNGSSIVTVSSPGNGYSPEIVVTLPNGGTFNGIDFAGSWEIVGKVSNGYTIDVSPQVANASSTVGGTGKLEQAAQFSKGDAAFDIRGEGWKVGTLRVKGDGRGRTAERIRPGDEDASNGTGGVDMDGGTLYVENTGPSRTNANGLTCGGRGVNMPSVFGKNLNQLVNFQTTAEGCSIALVQARDCNIAVAMRGNDNSVGTANAKDCGFGAAFFGGTTVDQDYLEEDAFEATEGSNVVKVKRIDHGKTTGALATINNSEAWFGVDPDGASQYITFIDEDHFSIVVSSTATGTGAFGGENATISWGEAQSGNNLMIGILKTSGCTVGAHIYAGTVGAQIGNRSSRNDTLDLIDCGTGTILYPPSTINPEAFKHASAAVTAGGIVTTAELGRISDFVDAEQADGNYEWEDDYFLFGAVADSIASRVSLKRRVTALVANAPTFTAYRGWTGDAVSAALGLRFTPSVNATKMTGGNMRFWWWQLNNVSGTKSIMGVSSGQSVRARPRGGANTMGVQIASALTAFVNSVTDSTGYGVVQRSGAATIEGQKNNTALTNVTGTSLSSALPTGEIYALARNDSGSISEPSDAQLFACGFGAPRSLVDRQAQYANLLALAQAVGAA